MTPLISPSAVPLQALERVRAGGKYLFAGREKLLVKGATYGPFRPSADGGEYGDVARVEADFEQMTRIGINAIRVYTVPPRWLLDVAAERGLRVMIGLPWEQHIAFLDDRGRAGAIERRVRVGVRACAGHPAVLCYAIGNEIPSSIVRWHGGRRVERFLRRLYEAAKEEDPQTLVTYVNFPTTEYLELAFLDLVCFNVYLERRDRLEAYLARLQNLSGDRPLLMAEIGLDSRRNGLEKQAEMLDWQIRVPFEVGCTGTFVFSWTDEWHRGGCDIEDWDFGLTTRDRTPKIALQAVRTAFEEVPFRADPDWPLISVVVCTHNGAGTLERCLGELRKLEYPACEVIVVDDGSNDSTADIVGRFPVRLIRTANHGLSSARNTGWRAAAGEIVAFLDDDAFPDPHWLANLAAAFRSSGHAGIGGPNIPPPDDSGVAEWVANAPGGPVHVLLSDTEAEHIPGCNMAFRKEYLEAIGGFDPQFRVAGDDVDLCWRILERGWTIGFAPGAMVWHRRRNTVRGYLRQQRGYGRAEAMLERKWPEKYNAVGHIPWAGRLYGKGLARLFGPRSRIYQGSWGSAPFQSVYLPRTTFVGSLPLMPEWYLLIGLLSLLALLGLVWTPLLAVMPIAAAAALAPLAVAVRSAYLDSAATGRRGVSRWRLFLGSGLLHLLQPIARLTGRLQYGLRPWRSRSKPGFVLPISRKYAIWSEQWRSPESWLLSLERTLRTAGLVVVHGGDFDDWDMEVRSGIAGAVRLRMGLEEHGAGRQLLRFHCRPVWGNWMRLALGISSTLALAAGMAGAYLPASVMALFVVLLVLGVTDRQGRGIAATRTAVAGLAEVASTAEATTGGGPEPSEGLPSKGDEIIQIFRGDAPEEAGLTGEPVGAGADPGRRLSAAEPG